MSDGWEVLAGMSSFKDRDVEVMCGEDPDSVKEKCLANGWGGFVLLKGLAHCKLMQPDTLRRKAVPTEGATFYLAPKHEIQRHVFGSYVEKGADPTCFTTAEESFEKILTPTYPPHAHDDSGKLIPSPPVNIKHPPESIEVEDGKKPMLKLTQQNVLIAASDMCFNHHLPLVLTPDVIWLTVVNGLAMHVNQNSETLRSKFVSHEGKVDLKVVSDHFVKGQHNDWKEVFSKWSEKVRDHIGKDVHENLSPHFTTTTPVTRAASEVVMLDVVQTYFTYIEMSSCGIPQFTIEGSIDDWRNMQRRVQRFLEIDPSLEWWTKPVVNVLREFELAAEGNPSHDFWRSWYKSDELSSGEIVTGNIALLFPYTVGRGRVTRNVWNEPIASPSEYPASLSNVPFIWKYHGRDISMRFLAGLFGCTYDKTDGVKPVVGWAVAEASK
eukprot:TRINITY_DN20996_c0_g1_i1.p1 TRINITY_DN20996_c0_g1~~TRINITY_DN20996_c0_g1_i1.p1  ORF type:complete len:452 (+),score=88.61 TRINITY_DN20996_c0_g1_i1:44-1357(+)